MYSIFQSVTLICHLLAIQGFPSLPFILFSIHSFLIFISRPIHFFSQSLLLHLFLCIFIHSFLTEMIHNYHSFTLFGFFFILFSISCCSSFQWHFHPLFLTFLLSISLFVHFFHWFFPAPYSFVLFCPLPLALSFIFPSLCHSGFLLPWFLPFHSFFSMFVLSFCLSISPSFFHLLLNPVLSSSDQYLFLPFPCVFPVMPLSTHLSTAFILSLLFPFQSWHIPFLKLFSHLSPSLLSFPSLVYPKARVGATLLAEEYSGKVALSLGHRLVI